MAKNIIADKMPLKLGCFFIVGLPLLALFMLAWGGHAYNRAKWDGVVDDLCKKNGGLVVYERPTIPKEEYDYYLKWGIPGKRNVIPSYGVPAYPGKYYRDFEPEKTIHSKGNPYEWGIRVTEGYDVIKNRDTGATIAKNTWYQRIGGTLIPPIVRGLDGYSCSYTASFEEPLSNLFIRE